MEYPHAINWISGFQPELAPNAEKPMEASVDSKEQSLRSEHKKRLKLENKLEKSQAEQERLHDQMIHYKREVETLRSQLADWENSFENRLVEAKDEHRRQWYSRYRKVDEGSVKTVKETLNRLDAILSRANQAFELHFERPDCSAPARVDSKREHTYFSV